jgi:serine/threonine-protein kinase
MSEEGTKLARVSCPHCGGAHRSGVRRCPSTGRALGGDARLIGQLIDRRYRVLRLLGDGPFGAVYKAEHVTVGRQVALRVLPSALLEHPVALNRFFREARLMSSVNHSRLHPLIDAGLAVEGVAYVAYQYVRGRSLSVTLAQDAPLPLEKATTLIGHVLEGLEAIHDSGFVHRALAPEAVILQMTASGLEQALLTNFGAAALEDEGGPLGVLSSLSPSLYVSESYTPPERRRGLPPDRREDIFAAGVMLAACLSPAGVPRFGGDLIAAGVPPAIEAIVARAVHPMVSARFGAAAEMRATLRPFARHGEDEPSSATRTHISDLRALARRERALGVLPSRIRLGQRGGAPRRLVDGPLGMGILRALDRLTSPDNRGELYRRVPGLERLVVAARDEDSAVPNLLLAAALEEGDALSGATDRLFCTAAGELTARVELVAALRQSQAGLTPEFFFDQVAPAWARVLGQGEARVNQIGRGYGRLEVRDQEEPALAICACLTGILSETLIRLGAHGVEISKTACEAVGDPACVYSATWM